MRAARGVWGVWGVWGVCVFAGALACGAPKTAHDADVPDPVDDRKNEVAAPVDQESSETGHYAGTEKSHDKTAETGSGTGSGKATEAETAPRGNMGTTAPVTTETHSNVPLTRRRSTSSSSARRAR